MPMDSAYRTAALPAVGFPIRTSPDQCLVSGSPTLFAATHVLLRLLSPRHPSCALRSLVISSSRSRDSFTKSLPGRRSLDRSCSLSEFVVDRWSKVEIESRKFVIDLTGPESSASMLDL